MEEENTTQKALDDLAALFLTGTSQQTKAEGASHTARSSSSSKSTRADGGQADDQRDAAQVRAESPHTSTQNPAGSSTRRSYDDLLTGPPPIRLSPKLRPTPGKPFWHPGQTQPLQMYRDDESAASSARQSADHPGAHDITVQAVILGNLPGLSGPWLTQYAQTIAQRQGPVALLHVDDDAIDAELLEPAEQPASAGQPTGSGLIDQLRNLVDHEHVPVRNILIHLEPDTRQPALGRLAAIDSWTFLCGADNAAVESAARTIRQLVEADETFAGKRISVMTMGSDGQLGRSAARRLAQATEDLLDAPVRFLGSQQQMMPLNLRQVGTFEPTVALWPALVDLFDELPQAVADLPSPGPAPNGATTRDPAPQTLHALQAEDDQHESPGEAVPASAAYIDEPSPAAAVGPAPGPQVQAAAAKSESDPEPDPELATFLTTGALAGGMALEARCPHQPRTQLLLDQAGRLHLLRRHASDKAAAALNQTDHAALHDLRAAILDLLQAQKWVSEHLDLLELTQRQCRFDHEAIPVLHLFTDRADLATGLVARLGASLKLHLLQRVCIGQSATWFSTPLS